MEDIIDFQADLKDLDEFPEELSDFHSTSSNKSPEQEQEQFSCVPSPSNSVCSQSSDQGSPPTSPFSHIKHSYTIPKTSISPGSYNNFHQRSSLCTTHHSVLCTVCCVSRPHTEVLHQSPDVVALPTASQAQTHSPHTPALAPQSDDQSPTVVSTLLLSTNRLPMVERRLPTACLPIPVTHDVVNANICSHNLLPKCLTCGNCICCTLFYNKQSTDSVNNSPAVGDSFSKQLTIDIPLIAPLNPSLRSPLCNTSLNTPEIQFSPVSPVTPVHQALFSSGTTTDTEELSLATAQAHIPCLLDIKVSPTKDFLKRHPPYDGWFSGRQSWNTQKCTRRRQR